MVTDGYFATTQDVLTVDPSAAMLCATPDNPDFTPQIGIASEFILSMLRQVTPRLTWANLDNPSQLKLACVYKTLTFLYRTAVTRHGSAASVTADAFQKDFDSIIKQRIDLTMGETVSLGWMRGVRG